MSSRVIPIHCEFSSDLKVVVPRNTFMLTAAKHQQRVSRTWQMFKLQLHQSTTRGGVVCVAKFVWPDLCAPLRLVKSACPPTCIHPGSDTCMSRPRRIVDRPISVIISSIATYSCKCITFEVTGTTVLQDTLPVSYALARHT